MALDEILSNLVEAFPKVVFPVDADLLYYDACQHDECLYLKKVFGKKLWCNVTVPDGDVRYRDDIIHFFSSKSLYYYLPTFFVFIAANYEKSDVLVDHLLSLILLKLQETSVQYDPVFFSEFFKSDEKVVAISNFLMFLMDTYHDDDAKNLYVMLRVLRGHTP
jgi:hypothetical protein